MKILVGCEESQTVTIAFRKRGFEAYSCDIQDCSGGHPEWHLKMDVFEAIKLKNWDAAIFFPPCTYLTNTANKWYKEQPKRKSGVLVGKERYDARADAILFFIKLYYCGIPKVAIENPVGIMSREFRKPDQIVQPYYFGEPYEKKTCLWLKNLPLLKPSSMITPEPRIRYKSGNTMPAWYVNASKLEKNERTKVRSKTFQGVADAMAEQWGNYLLDCSETNQ